MGQVQNLKIWNIFHLNKKYKGMVIFKKILKAAESQNV